MADVLVKQLVEAGVHFGHRASRWNPKMGPYIYGRQKLIHIIDVRETVRGLLRARKYFKQVAASGSLILFVGTKRQASDTIEREAARCGMPFVSQRWLGGTLTNFRTIRSRLSRLEQLEEILGGDQIQDYSKKMQSSLLREKRKMFQNLNGIRGMNRLPECLLAIDPNKERNSIREATKLGVTTVSLIDTDCDPDLVDLPIPGNDDSIRSVELITRILADAILEGKAEAAVDEHVQAEGSTPEPPKKTIDVTGAGKTGAGKTGAGKTGAGKTGAGKTGAGKTGAGKTGAGKTGAGKTGADKTGADETGADKTGADKAGAK